jgi:hypothetical protein
MQSQLWYLDMCWKVANKACQLSFDNVTGFLKVQFQQVKLLKHTKISDVTIAASSFYQTYLELLQGREKTPVDS